jgi:hypothetical protein
MAASVGWYDTDDVTALASIDLGAIPPGEDYFTRNGSYKLVKAKNDGDSDLATVNVEIQQSGSYPAYTYLRIANDGGSPGTPGTFQDHTANPLALGGMIAGAVAEVYIDVIVESTADPEAGQAANLVLLGSV